VALPATGTWANPGKGGTQADIVITASEDGVPLLFVEIDNCFESAQVLAGKIDKYMRFCQRKVKDVDGKERPMWRTRCSGGGAAEDVAALVIASGHSPGLLQPVDRSFDGLRFLYRSSSKSGGRPPRAPQAGGLAVGLLRDGVPDTTAPKATHETHTWLGRQPEHRFGMAHALIQHPPARNPHRS
jgi:hypothetical protein